MSDLAPAACPHCGTLVPSAFLGRICARCLLVGVATEVPLHDEPPDTLLMDHALPTTTVPGVRSKAEGLYVGARLGDYELVDVLGRGGMAVVYLARQVSLDRLVALKTIAAPLMANAPSQERFRREARAVAALDHPGIVSVHDAGVLQGSLFYTMDFVDGKDLARVLRERRLPAREAAGLVRQVAEAVGYAHSRGIVHRDLKPSNVLLDTLSVPHVVDFGLAFEAGEEIGRLTLTGDLLGTPPYMAPEMLAGGAGRAVPPTDVYALGAMLFEMLTGRTPFIGDSPSEILNLALHEQPPSPRLLNPSVPRDLEVITMRCLEKTPAARYADGVELAADLGRFLRGEPIHARPVSAPVRAWRWARRRPGLATFIVALLLGVVGATWSAFVINASRHRALQAEADAQEGLWRADLAHAQAARRTTQAGAREEALTAIGDAARFRPSLELRNEAIAALCLDDARVSRSWVPGGHDSGAQRTLPQGFAATAALVFAPSLETYLVETAPGQLVQRSSADDHELGRLSAPAGAVVGVPVFSPDGQFLAVRYADSTVRVWEVGARRVLFELAGRPSPTPVTSAKYGNDVAFRADGRQLAVGAPEGGFTLHAVPGGQEQGRWNAAFRPTILRYSPDSSRIAVASRQSAQVQFIDASALTVQRTVALPGVPICAAWSPAGDRLAVGTRASRIHFIVPETGEIPDTIPAYENGGVGQIVFHPSRPMIAGNGSDEAVRFWDTVSGRLLVRLDAVNNQPVLAFDPTGTRLGAYNNNTGRAALVDILPSPIYLSAAPAQPILSAIASGALDTSRDGRWLVTGHWGSVRLRDARTGQPVRTIPGADPNDIMTAQFTPDGRALLVNSIRNGLCRTELTGGENGLLSLGPVQALDPEPDFIIEGVAPDGRVLLVSEKRESAKVLDPANPGAALRWPVAKITSACFSPDGRQVLTEAGEPVPDEKAVKVWDVTTARPRLTASFGDDPGGRVQCSAAGGWVVVTGDKHTELWRFGSWERGPALPVDLQGEAHHARLSPDGATLVIETNGKTHLLATSTGGLLASCEGGSPAGLCVNEVFSGDGARLTLLWQYGVVHVWDLTAMHRELSKLGLDRAKAP